MNATKPTNKYLLRTLRESQGNLPCFGLSLLGRIVGGTRSEFLLSAIYIPEEKINRLWEVNKLRQTAFQKFTVQNNMKI